MECTAIFSQCGRYRYALGRIWDSHSQHVAFVGLNPSTADERVDDPTIRRCIAFARAWGFGGIQVLNLFAYRATRPADMLCQQDPVGPDNDHHLATRARSAALVVAAWGTLGTHLARDRAVRALLPNLHCLRLTKHGHPAHPLYLPAHLRPVPWPTAA